MRWLFHTGSVIRKLQLGDVLILDTGCTFDGYYCDFDRNYGFGQVEQRAHDAYKAVWEATEQGFLAAKPGNTPADLFHAMDGAEYLSRRAAAEMPVYS